MELIDATSSNSWRYMAVANLPKKTCHSALHATVATAAMLTATQADSAVTPDFCAKIEMLLNHTSANFAEITAPSKLNSDVGGVTLELTGAESCAVTSQLEGKSYHCVWKFPYRAKAALAAFADFNQGLQECIGDRATLHNDQDVNHPDFYDLRLYELDRAKVSVSVKDKSALHSTFLFIRVSP